jgi:cytochrome c2
MSVRLASQALGFSAGLLLCSPTTFEAADFSKQATRGKVILQEKCGRCHAIEAVGESPLKKAPPMRDIYGRFNPRELQAQLSEGKVSRVQTQLAHIQWTRAATRHTLEKKFRASLS